jgi:hypothetical protein
VIFAEILPERGIFPAIKQFKSPDNFGFITWHNQNYSIVLYAGIKVYKADL